MKLYQRHRRRAIIVSHNIHNIMAIAKYTSNGLSTDLIVHQLIELTAFQLHLYRLHSPNLYQLFVSSNLPFQLWKQIPIRAKLQSINWAILCQIQQLFQPCWLSTAQFGFDSSKILNKRSVPSQKIVSCERSMKESSNVLIKKDLHKWSWATWAQKEQKHSTGNHVLP